MNIQNLYFILLRKGMNYENITMVNFIENLIQKQNSGCLHKKYIERFLHLYLPSVLVWRINQVCNNVK